MKYKLRPLLTLFFMLIFLTPDTSVRSLPTANPKEAGFSGERLNRINQVVQAYVDEQKIAGAVTLISRKGKLAYLQTFGMADIEAQRPMQPDTLFRIASMTKPITTVALMMLWEEGKFLLTDPLAKYLPEFQNPQVLVISKDKDSNSSTYKLVPANKPITIHHLLTHTSGITYTFQGTPYISDMYKKAGVCDGLSQTSDTLAENVARLARMPLHFQPGEGFDYGLGIDVAGRLVEVLSGLSLDEFFRERIFKPLGMKDTCFYLPEDKLYRLAALYQPTKNGLEKYGDEVVEQGLMKYSASYPYKGDKKYYSGGAGLVSTAEDYWRFLQMLLNGGQFDNVKLLSRKTVEYMTANHIGDLVMWNSPFDGYRFGLGFAVRTDLGASAKIGSVGEYTWGGFFSTTFWVDPKEQMIGIMLVQLRPNEQLDVHDKFKVLAYQAITD
ncbi:MAG: beta-lactamase family protein [Acidobacteria bacterium]|nr:beta-lactamase family protein [Acidobacteriota bacterium]